jgi:hypothetical protein
VLVCLQQEPVAPLLPVRENKHSAQCAGQPYAPLRQLLPLPMGARG